MKNSTTLPNERLNSGDAAVKGLFNGFIAGLTMAIVLVVAGLTRGVPAASTLDLFTPVPGSGPLGGGLAHLAVSGIYGMLFGLIWSGASRLVWWKSGIWPAIFAGAIYGLLLWLGAQYILLPTTGAALGSLPPAQFLIAHLVYGLILGGLIGRGK